MARLAGVDVDSRKRPRAGTVTSAAVDYDIDTVPPLPADELADLFLSDAAVQRSVLGGLQLLYPLDEAPVKLPEVL